ncbi:hypothetical protein, conserved [Eimeria brunetti]|uniref:Uncharacterized protein n=1 Tax=Eimeria brunetti TaxID=51314 RepID=U6LDA5_9EIME|nr:hypothetical protein, conserved [Eimeria brunetti]
MYSSMLSGIDFIRRHGTLGKDVPGTGADPAPESSPALLTGWGGRWQLTPMDSPLDSFSSCSGSNRSGSAPVNPFASTCKDGEFSRGPQGGSVQSQAQMQHVDVCGSDAVRPCSPVESPPPTANSGTQRATLAADEGNAKVYPGSAHVASEGEASYSATEVSDSAESERRRALAKCLHGLMLHRAQQHFESQCREALKKKDMRLNILITALPGVDADLFCKQMFAEWQEVSRQRVSCGDEFVFRAPFVVPLVEVPVIAATSFASVLPYCELRLLEEWERDAVLEEEATERRVLRTVFHFGALWYSRGILRLQLAASDLATLEEMLLPLGSTARGPEICAYCQRRMQEKEYQQSAVHSEPPLLGKGSCSSDDAEKCIDGTIPYAQEPRILKGDNHAENIDDRCSSGSSKNCRQEQTTENDATTPDIQGPHTVKPNSCGESIKNSRSSCIDKKGSKGEPADGDGINIDIQRPETLEPDDNAACIHKSHSSDSCNVGQPSDSGGELHRRSNKLHGGSTPATKHRCKMQSFSGGPMCLSAVHLPLVLQLPLSCDDNTPSQCTCRAGVDSFSGAVTTPLSLRGMLVEASAVLLRQRAEYGCFLPFLFQQQMLPNRAHKLRGLQQWEYEEKQQRKQQQHVEALVDLRQGQIDSHPNADTAMRMQRQLDGLREQLRRMQQQLLNLQERKFLQELLREETSGALPYPVPDGRVLLQNTDTGNCEREELLSQVAQTGLVLALMLGVGAMLFNTESHFFDTSELVLNSFFGLLNGRPHVDT